MRATHYQDELDQLATTYENAFSCDVSALKNAIAGASESSIIAVGSGGSFTVASLLCALHEAYTGRVSRPATPLEIICNPTLAASSPVFLISAEGKNPDITEALQRARRHSARAIHVLTNRTDSPLMTCVAALTEVNAHVFALDNKDGYLATNSLLLDAILLARAYGELDESECPAPVSIRDLRVAGVAIEDWITGAADFIDKAAARGAMVVTYSPQLQPIAADLESKLAEAALLHCQLADLRSFAHGRHLWLAQRAEDIVVIALTEPSLSQLWESMQALFPAKVPTLAMALEGSTPWDLIAGLVAQMYLINAIGNRLGKDPGHQMVPQFGRDLYYIDLPSVIPRPQDSARPQERSKYEVLGARWPSPQNRGDMTRARNAFVAALEAQTFRAIVFDYDGTLCHSQRKNAPPPERIVKHLQRLIEANVIVGIASGRGGSIQECLASQFPSTMLPRIQLGLYNGGWIDDASRAPAPPKETSEFLSHVIRIVRKLEALGVPIQDIRPTHPFQVSVRFREGLPTEQMWFVIADSLRQAGLDIFRMHRSKHSVDILAPRVGKAQLIAHIIQTFKIDPYDIVTMGDQGAWPGNDADLLEHRYSLSVDMPSRRIDRGWKLAPEHKRDVDATLWYLDRLELLPDRRFKLAVTDTTGEGVDRAGS
jgi:HAD superfamily hydrolase (TIGR01484 family)